jgi:hypothetical protein
VERHGGDSGAVGQFDLAEMTMHLVLAVHVADITTPRWLVDAPRDPTIPADHHGANLEHGR